jgi:hypothetical protein
MSPSDPLQAYADLLRTRHAAARRTTLIVGSLFAAGLVAAFFASLYTEPNSRTVLLSLIMLMALGMGVLSISIRAELLKALLELADTLRREGSDAP